MSNKQRITFSVVGMSLSAVIIVITLVLLVDLLGVSKDTLWHILLVVVILKIIVEGLLRDVS